MPGKGSLAERIDGAAEKRPAPFAIAAACVTLLAGLPLGMFGYAGRKSDPSKVSAYVAMLLLFAAILAWIKLS